MTIAAGMLPELDHEMATTRRVLERVPADRADWRPHAKSMTMGELAMHVAGLAGWITSIAQDPEFDVAPVVGPPPERKRFTTTEALVATFDDEIVTARAALAATTDDAMMHPWSLRAGATTIFTMKRVAVLRSFGLNHLIHHRGQLSVYLRLCDVPLPEMYGPTADSVR